MMQTWRCGTLELGSGSSDQGHAPEQDIEGLSENFRGVLKLYISWLVSYL